MTFIRENGGIPSLQQLIDDTKEYFEGPVNLQLMEYGAIKNFGQKMAETQSSKEEIQEFKNELRRVQNLNKNIANFV